MRCWFRSWMTDLWIQTWTLALIALSSYPLFLTSFSLGLYNWDRCLLRWQKSRWICEVLKFTLILTGLYMYAASKLVSPFKSGLKTEVMYSCWDLNIIRGKPSWVSLEQASAGLNCFQKPSVQYPTLLWYLI